MSASLSPHLTAKAVLIGASAGAVQALLQILPGLPKSFPLPILVVVHVPPDRNNSLVPLLESRCQMQVKEAEDKEPARGGVIYFAPSDYHLLVETDGALSLSSDELVHHSRPSIDVLFESASDAFGADLIGIILTGANQDGAHGLKMVAARSGLALVQDPGSAEAPTMPREALRLTASAKPMTLEAIASYLSSFAA